MNVENIDETVKTGYAMARLLREHNVNYIFGVPDGHTLGFYDGLLNLDGIEHVLFNDERSAAYAADAYARVTGTLGVCDSGAVGAANFPISLAEAKGSASPVLAIIGMIKSQDFLRNIPHDINISEILAPVTKWTGKVLDVNYLPRFMNFAIRQAINGKPGPVALIISEDIINFTESKLKNFLPRNKGSCSINGCRSVPARSEIESAVDLIRKARQPAIFTGNGAIVSGAFTEVAELSRLLKAPVFSTISGKGIMDFNINFENNLYFGTIGLFGEKPNHRFIRSKTDLLIVVGNRLTEDNTANFKIPSQNLEMIQIDIDAAEIGLSYSPIGVVGDPKEAIKEIIKSLLENRDVQSNNKEEIITNRIKNLDALKKWHNEYRNLDNEKWMLSNPIKPQRILKAISDNFTKNDYLITDASSCSRWIGAYFPVKGIGRKIITPRGVGPTGFGVGALIGTCIADGIISPNNNKSKKILFTGDGGLMNGGINEFETIKKLDLNCSIIVINNFSLGFVKFGQAMLFKHNYYETDRPKTNFGKITESFGGYGMQIENLSQLDSAIKDAINYDGFSLVDVIIDPIELLPPNFY